MVFVPLRSAYDAYPTKRQLSSIYSVNVLNDRAGRDGVDGVGNPRQDERDSGMIPNAVPE